jgi:hypothetical protein
MEFPCYGTKSGRMIDLFFNSYNFAWNSDFAPFMYRMHARERLDFVEGYLNRGYLVVVENFLYVRNNTVFPRRESEFASLQPDLTVLIDIEKNEVRGNIKKVLFVDSNREEEEVARVLSEVYGIVGND